MPRRAVASVLVFASCTMATRVRDLPADAPLSKDRALLAGRLVLEGTRIGTSLRLRSAEGREIVLQPADTTFLVEVPPGAYAITRFGSFRPKGAPPAVEARAGEAVYVGSFFAGTLRQGELPVVVRDERDPVAPELRTRYGDRMPALERGPVKAETLTVVPTSVYYDKRHYKRGFHYARRK